MGNKTIGTNPTQGFFIAFKDEAAALQVKKVMNIGQGGIFKKKDELVTTIESNDVINNKNMMVVEILAFENMITRHTKSKFGVKMGYNIPITKIQSFEEAQKELKCEQPKVEREMAIA